MTKIYEKVNSISSVVIEILRFRQRHFYTLYYRIGWVGFNITLIIDIKYPRKPAYNLFFVKHYHTTATPSD